MVSAPGFGRVGVTETGNKFVEYHGPVPRLDPRKIAALFDVPTWVLGLPWRPGEQEHPRLSRMHAAYRTKRRHW